MNAALQDEDEIIVLSLFDYNDEKYGFTGDYGGADVDDDGVSTDDDARWFSIEAAEGETVAVSLLLATGQAEAQLMRSCYWHTLTFFTLSTFKNIFKFKF